MDRKEFLLTIGKGAAFAGLVYCVGCSQNSYDPVAPTNVDLTFDLSQSTYAALNTVGGSYVTSDGIIIGRVNTNSFVAVQAACTHQGTTIQFQLNNNRFYCPNHGSTYALDGTVTNGPAERSLAKYNTSFTGNNLRIFS